MCNCLPERWFQLWLWLTYHHCNDGFFFALLYEFSHKKQNSFFMGIWELKFEKNLGFWFWSLGKENFSWGWKENEISEKAKKTKICGRWRHRKGRYNSNFKILINSTNSPSIINSSFERLFILVISRVFVWEKTGRYLGWF